MIIRLRLFGRFPCSCHTNVAVGIDEGRRHKSILPEQFANRALRYPHDLLSRENKIAAFQNRLPCVDLFSEYAIHGVILPLGAFIRPRHSRCSASHKYQIEKSEYR